MCHKQTLNVKHKEQADNSSYGECTRMKSLLSAFLIAVMIGGFGLAGTLQLDKAQASTDVTGIIYSDTTWTPANSPYSLTGPVGVASGVTLTIEPGTTINLKDYYIQVNGTLVARGTSTNPINLNGETITFTTTSEDYNEQTGSGCIIENAHFSPSTDEYGNTRSISEVTIDDSAPKIIGNSNFSITVNDGSPIISKNTLKTVKITSGAPKILNNIIGSISIDKGSPQIFSNTICGGIDAYDYPVDGSPVIWNNTITSSGRVAVMNLQFKGMPIISNNNITGLVRPGGFDIYGRPFGPEYTGYGIRITGNAYFYNNVISGCRNASILVYGSSNSEVVIQNNTLNSKGIMIKGAISTTINYNNIEGGISLSQSASTDVDAIHNWWGTTDTQAIRQSIFDFKDDFTLGKVTFEPFLTAPNSEATPDPNSVQPAQTPSTPTDFTTIASATIIAIALAVGLAVIIYLIKRK